VTRSDELSRRERQIMDAVFARGTATVDDVCGALAEPPTRTTVRTLMRILEEKGHLTHRKDGRSFVYRPIKTRRKVGRSALRGVLDTFFDGSLEKAVTAHLTDPSARLSAADIARIEALLADTRRRQKEESA